MLVVLTESRDVFGLNLTCLCLEYKLIKSIHNYNVMGIKEHYVSRAVFEAGEEGVRSTPQRISTKFGHPNFFRGLLDLKKSCLVFCIKFDV